MEITMSRQYIKDRFLDKVAIVTGGSAGIGRAIVEELCKEGAKVLFSGLPNDGNDTEKELIDLGYNAACMLGDMSDEDFCRELSQKAYQLWGKVDYLVNNAFSFRAKGLGAKREDWDKIFSAGPIAFSHMTQLVSEHMQKGSAIVNVSSTSAHIAQADRWTYNSAKGAVHQLTKCCALDLAKKGIRVNSISPAWIRTREAEKCFNHASPEQYDKVVGKYHMLGRSGNPSECAAATLFLLSDDASFITATDLRVDGGFLSMGPEGHCEELTMAGSD